MAASAIAGGLIGLRSLAAAAGRKPTSFQGADGADALQRIGQPWPLTASLKNSQLIRPRQDETQGI
jgi:hypothetical protein